MNDKKMENIFYNKIFSVIKQIWVHAEGIDEENLKNRCKMLSGELILEREVNDLKKEKKLGEFIHNIIADLESNIKFQPTDVLYADMAGKLSAYKYIKKSFLEA